MRVTSLSNDLDNVRVDLGAQTSNLLDVSKLSGTGITISNGVVRGTSSALKTKTDSGGIEGLTFKENTRYIFSGKGRNTGDVITGIGIIFAVKYTDGTSENSNISNSKSEYSEFSLVTDPSKTVELFKLSYGSGGNNVWELSELMIEEGSIQSAYIPYNTASDYVMRIKTDIVKGLNERIGKVSALSAQVTNGDISIPVSNFEIGNITMGSNNLKYFSSNSRVRTKKSMPIYLTENMALSVTGGVMFIAYVDESGTYHLKNGWVSSYTTPANGYYYLLMRYSTESEITDLNAFVSNLKITPITAEDPSEGITYESPLRFKPLYDHLFVNDQTITIPHESLYHVRLSRVLGFNCIEANIAGKTSDNVWIVNHLTSGKFGRYFYDVDGIDISDTPVSSVTWDYIVNKVRYNTTIEKYRTRPCRLEEFLSECKQQNVIPFVGSADSGVYAICDEYMGKGNYIAYGATRQQCPNSVIYHWSNLTTKADILAYCQSVGRPFIYGMSNPGAFTDSELIDIVQTLHESGYWIGTSYQDNAWYKFRNMGFDALGSLTRINRIKEGNVCNIDSIFGFSGFTYTNATESNGVLTFSADGILTPTFTAETISVGGFDIEIHFDGEIVIPTVGKHLILRYTSDGSYPVFASAPILNGSPAMAIQVKSGTIVYDASYKVSKF